MMISSVLVCSFIFIKSNPSLFFNLQRHRIQRYNDRT